MQAADAPEDLSVSAMPGAINICIGCLNVSIYDDAMNLRRPTFTEFTEFVNEHGAYLVWMQENIKEAKAAVDARNEEARPASRDVN